MQRFAVASGTLLIITAIMTSSIQPANTSDASAVPAGPEFSQCVGSGYYDESVPKIFVGEMVDGTTVYTRDEVDAKAGKAHRYYSHPITFGVDGQTSNYLKCNEVLVPYVPPPPAKKDSPPANYGVGFIYAALPPSLLDAIANAAAESGLVVSLTEPRILSTKSDWWVTISLNEKNPVKVCLDGENKRVSLARIFTTTKAGVSLNAVLSIKLKCKIEESKDDNGQYLPWYNPDPVYPNENDIWTVAVQMHTAFLDDTEIAVALPAKPAFQSNAPVFKPREEDKAKDALVAKLRKLNIV